MGVAIRAAIVVGTAAAVYGVAKLRDTSQQATQAINATNAAGARSQSVFSKIRNTMGGISGTRQFVSGGQAQVTPLWQRIFGNPDPGTMTKTQNNIKLAIRATNTLRGVAQEARGWYKLLWGQTARSPGGGLKRMAAMTSSISTGAKKATDNFSNLSAMFAGTLAAMGGTALLSGSGGIFERAFDLSRAKEDAKTTFDTLLGSRQLTDDLTGRIYKYAAATPFQSADILEASKNLLSITGKDLGKNERLYKLAASMAALRPGTTVEDASQAILRATFGEFDPLKTFTIAARAEMFKGAGEVGGQAYADAVIKEIETQFTAKTGGRDIVGALAMTMSGLMSTIKDSLDLPLGGIGDKLVEGLGIKKLMSDYIEQATYFGEYFADLLQNGPRFAKYFADPKTSSGVMAIADAVYSAVMRIIAIGKTLIGWAKMTWSWFNSLGSSVQGAMLGAAAGTAAFATAVGIITPIVTGLVALIAVVGEPILAVGTAIGGVGAIVAAVLGVLVAGALSSIGVAFMFFRKEGESFTDTLHRLGGYVSAGFRVAWESLTTVFLAFWGVVQPKLLPAWQRIEAAFARIRPYFVEIMDLMFGTTLTTQELADYGAVLGDIFLGLLDITVSLIELGLYGIGKAMEFVRPMWSHSISDAKLMYKTLFSLVGGTMTFKEALKTLFYGTVDLVTIPFRLIISHLFNSVSVALTKAAEMVRPFSSLVADNINAAAKSAVSAAESVNEGFLKTRRDLLGTDSSLSVKVSGDVSASVPVQLNLDGERVAESQARVAMRARNSGRGGDPMTPEEMGFVINDGRIRTVDMSAVSTSAAGGG